MEFSFRSFLTSHSFFVSNHDVALPPRTDASGTMMELLQRAKQGGRGTFYIHECGSFRVDIYLGSSADDDDEEAR